MVVYLYAVCYQPMQCTIAVIAVKFEFECSHGIVLCPFPISAGYGRLRQAMGLTFSHKGQSNYTVKRLGN